MNARIRKNASKTAVFLYAGYKWLEDHTDDVERWSGHAIQRSRGKRYEKVVVPVAGAARAAARWVRENNDVAPTSRRIPP
jgi:hypothetical protein